MLAVASVAAFTLLLAGCNTTNNKGTTATSDSVAKSSESKTKDSVDLNSLDLPQLDDKVAEDQDLVQMVTSMGNIEIKLFPKQAPKTVENFMKHAKDGYYDGLTFHRVINNFMIQGGDPSGDGTGGNSIWNKPFEDEFSNQLYNIRGALSMANAGPNTNGSQFFIVQNTGSPRPPDRLPAWPAWPKSGRMPYLPALYPQKAPWKRKSGSDPWPWSRRKIS